MEKEKVFKQLGKNIKTARVAKGFSQEVLAEKLGKSVNLVSLAERGQSGISIETLVDLCNILEIVPNSLFMQLIQYNNDSQENYIMDNISAFSNQDKDILIKLIDYIRESKK